MQNEQVSSHNHIEVKKQSRHTFGGIVLGTLLILFAFYGAWDIFSRIGNGMNAENAIDTGNSAIQNPTNLPPSISSTTTSAVALPVPFTPDRLIIPDLSINTHVQLVGQTPQGLMANPKGFTEVGWYRLGSKPGEEGNAVIAGHVNNALGLSGVFERLGDLTLGSEITIKGEGKEITYVVRELHVYRTNDAPTERIFARSGSSALILVTCDGAWDAGIKSYDKRLVVIADPK